MSEIGLRLPNENHGYSIPEIVDYGVRAEEMGYDSLWQPENHGREAFMVLSLLADRTERVTLSTGIVSVYARAPGQLAMAVATLDEISDGRAAVGIGPSAKEAVEDWLSVDYDRPLRRVRETIELLNEAFENERVSYDGDIFQIDDYPRTYTTVQDNIPIYNAALGATNRKLTGEFADGWLPVSVPIDQFSEKMGEVRDAAANAGRDPDEVTIAPYIISCVNEDGQAAREQAAGLLAFYIGAMDYYAGVFRDLGYENEVADIRDHWNAGDRHDAIRTIIDTGVLRDVGIAGTPEEGREQLAEYYEEDVDMPIVYPAPGDRELIESTATELAPEQ